jgi:hypothetical protein
MKEIQAKDPMIMTENEWKPLPSLWPGPAASRTLGEYDLLVFTEQGVPTWEVRNDVRKDPKRNFDLIASGTADSFDAAKAAAVHVASMLMVRKGSR